MQENIYNNSKNKTLLLINAHNDFRKLNYQAV